MSDSVAVVARPPLRLAKIISLALVLLAAITFIMMNAIPYLLHYGPSQFDVYWPRRYGLLLHISGGMVALLIGPWQFSQRLRQRNLRLHRILGHAYLISILLGSVGGIYLAFTTTFGRAWGLALLALATAWLTTSGMAFYMIKHRQVQLHREWMVRSYIVTFGFVSFRALEQYGPTHWLGPRPAGALTWIWLCWALPLLVNEVVLSLRKVRS
jgi:uncharacterized membrane protein